MGKLDTIARDGVVTAIKAIGRSDLVSIKRTVVTYDDALGTESEVETTVSFLASPQLAYETRQVDGKNVLRTDTYILVAAATLEAANATFGEPDPDTDVVVMTSGTTFKLESITVDSAGDLPALYTLQLRK